MALIALQALLPFANPYLYRKMAPMLPKRSITLTEETHKVAIGQVGTREAARRGAHAPDAHRPTRRP